MSLFFNDDGYRFTELEQLQMEIKRLRSIIHQLHEDKKNLTERFNVIQVVSEIKPGHKETHTILMCQHTGVGTIVTIKHPS